MVKRKLSELIRMGAAMVNNRQCKDDYIKLDEMGEISLCADGAAYYALTGELPKPRSGYTVFNSPAVKLEAEFGMLTFVQCDTVDMNDRLGMTFEEIAQALEAEGY